MFWRRIREYCKFLKSLMLTNGRLLRGMWKLTKLPQPTITVFGGSRISQDSIYSQQARRLARMLASSGFSIITGGGSGIMEAANFGAVEATKKNKGGVRPPLTSMGIGLLWFREARESINPYVQDQIIMYHFFSRKWLLVRYAVGFVVFPGGFGTMDELFEVITLIQCNRMPPYPIVLMDKNYWQPILDWIYNKALKEKLISKDDLKIITVADNEEEAFKIITSEYKKQKGHQLLYASGRD